MVILLALASAREAAAQVAKFRVTDVKQSGDTASVTIAWEYSGAAAGNSSRYNGQGVKLFLHNSSPGYGNSAKGTPVGTLDMTNGSGTHTVKLDTKALKLTPGQSLVLTGLWPSSSHQWGTDSSRPGGDFKLPAKANGLRGITPIKAGTPSLKQLGPSSPRGYGSTSNSRPFSTHNSRGYGSTMSRMSTRTKSSNGVRATAGRAGSGKP